MNVQDRIVVTGLGVVSSIGQNPETFFNNAIAGKVGISDVKGFDVSQMKNHRGGEIHDFDVSEHFPNDDAILSYGRAKQFALVAAQQCLGSLVEKPEIESHRFGLAFGFTQGESKILESFTHDFKAGLNKDYINYFSGYAPKKLAQSIASRFNLHGPNLTIGQACSAGTFVIGLAVDALRSGEADAFLAGGADAFSRYCYAGFSRLGAIATDTPRPFSGNRTGMIPAEGAGMLLLETLSSARKRNAHIYAEIVGYGESADAHHITQPSADGIARAINMAIKDADIAAEKIDYISVHGTGTRASDSVESEVLNSIYQGKPPLISSIKSMIGHSMGAAASIECVASILAMRDQILPPTMGYMEEDPECPVNCIPNKAQKHTVNYVLKTASAFGGQNAAVVFKRWSEEEFENV